MSTGEAGRRRIFGPSQARTMQTSDAATVARFLRREPLWPLLRAIWKFRRMDAKAFEMCMALADPLGENFARSFPLSGTDQ